MNHSASQVALLEEQNPDSGGNPDSVSVDAAVRATGGNVGPGSPPSILDCNGNARESWMQAVPKATPPPEERYEKELCGAVPVEPSIVSRTEPIRVRRNRL